MRILHVSEAHAVHTDRIARHQIAAGYEVSVATWHDLVGTGPVHTFRTPAYMTRLPYHHHWARIGSFADYLRSFDPDVVHGHYLSTAALYLAVAAGYPTVASAMGSDVLLDTRALHARLLLRALPVWTDRFTSVAPHVTRRMVELGLPGARIDTFPWGVDTDVFHPPPAAREGHVVVSTRNFEPTYDLPTLLDAFARLATSHPEVRLRLFGDGSQRPRIAARIGTLTLDGRVVLEGRVPEPHLAEALRDASVYVTAAISDGASTSLLEAMATGLVPVATDIDANRAWIRDGDNGLLFPPGHVDGLVAALDRALTDRALRSRCRERNPREIAEHASWARSMGHLDSVYRRLRPA
ncbi:MAG: glycosyltransferase family 4 protein [Methanobacteriota archaeon]